MNFQPDRLIALRQSLGINKAEAAQRLFAYWQKINAEEPS